MRSEYGPDMSERSAQAAAASKARIERSRDIAGGIGITSQEISEIEQNADNISLFGKIRDGFGGLIANAKQSVTARVAAAGLALAALGSACENPIKSDPRDNPEKTPTVLTPPPIETGTPLVIPTVTRTPRPTEVVVPTDTETPSPTATETATSVSTPTPEKTPPASPTPEKTKKPENPFTQEFWDGIFENYDKIDWVSLSPVLMDKDKEEHIRQSLQEYARVKDYKMFLRQILGISAYTEKYDDEFQWTNNPPRDFTSIPYENDEDYMKKLKDLESKGVMAETLEHLILRTRIVGPIVENLKLLWGADSPKFEQIQILLEETPIDWNSDRFRYRPYKPFIDKLAEVLGEEGTQFTPEDQKLYLAVFKLTLVFNDPVKAIDLHVQTFCDQNNGSDQDNDMRDKFITPFLQMMLEQDFSTRIKDKVEGYLSRCVVN